MTRLASDELEGRLSGSPGEVRAGDFAQRRIAPYRRQARTTPTSRCRSSSRPARATAARGCRAHLPATTSADIQALSFSDNGDVANARRLRATASSCLTASSPYDSYATLDVKDKVVLVLRYYRRRRAETKGIPRDMRTSATRRRRAATRCEGDPSSPVTLAQCRGRSSHVVRHCALRLRHRGSEHQRPALMRCSRRSAMRRRHWAPRRSRWTMRIRMCRVSICRKLSVSVHTDVVREKKTGHNLVAYLPATRTVPGVQKPWLAVGAHYDHLGKGRDRQLACQKPTSLEGTTAPTTTRLERPPCWRWRKRWRHSRARATCCCGSGRAKLRSRRLQRVRERAGCTARSACVSTST